MKLYSIVPTKRYKKDYKRIKKSGFDSEKLERVIDTLAEGKKLPDKNKDHELKGEFAGLRECHIGPDWLLLYRKESEKLILVLIGTGTHRDIFGIE